MSAFNVGWKTKTPDETIALIRNLRYEDGLPARKVADMLGVTMRTIFLYAPGRPGKVPVAPLREAFKASPLTAADVARSLGWWARGNADSGRVKRTLGINEDSARGYRFRREMVDAETVTLMADALGIAPWSVLPEDGGFLGSVGSPGENGEAA